MQEELLYYAFSTATMLAQISEMKTHLNESNQMKKGGPSAYFHQHLC